MKFFFKFLCSFVLIISLVSPAFAILPALALTAAEIAGAAIVSGGLTYLLGQPGSGNLPSYGKADNYGVKRNLLGKVGPAAAVAVAGALAYYDLRNGYSLNPSAYPNLSGALNQTNVSSPSSSSSLSGLIVQYTRYNDLLVNGYVQLGSIKYSPYSVTGNCILPDEQVRYYTVGYYVQVFQYGGTTTCTGGRSSVISATNYNISSLNPTITSSPRPDSELPAVLNGPDGNLAPQYQPEVDGIIQGNPNAVSLPSGDVAAAQSSYNAGQAAAAAQNAVNAQQAAYNSNPTAENLARLEELRQQLADALANQGQQILSENDRAAEEAEKAAEQEAADAAIANLGPANTYDSTINTPESKNITGLMNTFFDNSPLLGIVRSFQISTTDQQALFSFGTFWGQEITVDFTRWADVLAGCGAVLLVLSHAYAVFIVVRG